MALSDRQPLLKDNTEANSNDVINAASVLQISEYRLFQLAYMKWYAEDVDEQTIDKYFKEYLLHARVPHWVRHMARRILQEHERGVLDPSQYQINQSVATSGMFIKGVLILLLLALLMVLFYVVVISEYTPYF